MEEGEGSGLNGKTLNLMADFVENSAGDEDEKAAMEQYFMESPAASADFFDRSLDFSAENAKQSSSKEDEEPAPEPSPPRSSSSQKKGPAGVSSSLPLRWAAKSRSLRIRRSPPVVVEPPLPPPPPPPPSSPPPARSSTRPELTVRKSTGALSSTTLRIAPAPAADPPSSSSPRRTTRRKPVSSPAVRIPAVAARKEALGPSPAPSAALSPGRSSSASGSSSSSALGKLLPEFYVNRKPWTKREDEALRNYAAGNKKNWKKIASLLKKWERPYEDCIVRFYTVIRPAGGRGRRATTRGDEEEELNQENRVAKISADVCEIKKSIMELRAEMNVIGEKVDKILSTITNQK